jgi:hypothetical protein
MICEFVGSPLSRDLLYVCYSSPPSRSAIGIIIVGHQGAQPTRTKVYSYGYPNIEAARVYPFE